MQTHFLSANLQKWATWGAGYRAKLIITITVFNDAMPAAMLSDIE